MHINPFSVNSRNAAECFSMYVTGTFLIEMKKKNHTQNTKTTIKNNGKNLDKRSSITYKQKYI